jgi:hypothetical protein
MRISERLRAASRAIGKPFLGIAWCRVMTGWRARRRGADIGPRRSAP